MFSKSQASLTNKIADIIGSLRLAMPILYCGHSYGTSHIPRIMYAEMLLKFLTNCGNLARFILLLNNTVFKSVFRLYSMQMFKLLLTRIAYYKSYFCEVSFTTIEKLRKQVGPTSKLNLKGFDTRLRNKLLIYSISFSLYLDKIVRMHRISARSLVPSSNYSEWGLVKPQAEREGCSCYKTTLFWSFYNEMCRKVWSNT